MIAAPGVSVVVCTRCGERLSVPQLAVPGKPQQPPQAQFTQPRQPQPPPSYRPPPQPYAPAATGPGAGGGVGARPVVNGGPPPQYGRGPVPPQYSANGGVGGGAMGAAPPPSYTRAPAAPAAPAPAKMTPAQLFATVDTDRSGTINANELKQVLSDGGYHKFSNATTAMIMRMFDFEHTGVLSWPQFEALCGYLNAWRDMFNRADTDGSGGISYEELQRTLTAMGYALSAPTLSRMWLVYDEDKSGTLQFDEYIMLMAELKMTTAAFAQMDPRHTGRVTLDFNQFLQLLVKTKVL